MSLDVDAIAHQVAAEVERHLRSSWEGQIQEILHSSVQEERARRHLAEERLTDLMTELLAARRTPEPLTAAAPPALSPPMSEALDAASSPLALEPGPSGPAASGDLPASSAPSGRRRRRRIGKGPFALVAVLAVTAATVGMAQQADAYEAEATVLLPDDGLTADEVTAVGEIDPVVDRVAESVSLDADEVVDGLEATAAGGDEVRVTFRDDDDSRARRAASTAATAALEIAFRRRMAAVQSDLDEARGDQLVAIADVNEFVERTGLTDPAVDLGVANAEIADLRLERVQAADDGDEARISELDGTLAERQQRLFDIRNHARDFEALGEAGDAAEAAVAASERRLEILADQAATGAGALQVGATRVSNGISPAVLLVGALVCAAVLLATRTRRPGHRPAFSP